MLTDYADRRLSLEKQREVELHLDQCEHCSGQVTFLSKLLERMRADTGDRASRAAFARVVSAMAARATERPQSLVRKILAVLQSEIPALTPALGERSGGSSIKQYLYSAEQNAIDLQVTPHEHSTRVDGLILGPVAPGHAELIGTSTSQVCIFDESGRFSFAEVPAGEYRLNLCWGMQEIEVNALNL